jgi:deoxyribonuclease-4
VTRKGPLLGAHVSVAGGVHTAPERGKKIGADVVQIFSKQNTRWEGKALEEGDARALREESARTGVRVAAIHCAYLINLGSTNETVRTRSLYALEDEASRAAMLGVPYLVMHPGSCGENPVEEGISRIASAVRSFGKFPKGVTLLLENTAGQGNSIGRTMEQLRELLDTAGNPADVAVCLDSAHLFESGYDIGTAAGWDALLVEVKEKGILPLGSRVDRHEHIGEGRIDLSAFRRILNHKEFAALPMVLETPKGEDDEFTMDLRNLATLRKLIA